MRRRPVISASIPLMTAAIAGVLIAVVAAMAAPAEAWRQYTTSQGEPMRWSERSLAGGVPYSIADRELPQGQPSLAALQIASAAAAAAWSEPTCGTCALGVQLSYLGLRPPQPVGLNCLKRDGHGRCAAAEPNGNQITPVVAAERWPFGSMTVALTLISALPHGGLIADVDIALNAADFTFCTDSCKALQPGLKSTLLHEMGHLLGLDHSFDKDAAMHAAADVFGGAELSLGADDIAGVCAAYGLPQDSPACSSTDAHDDPLAQGCCSVGRGGRASGAALALLALAVLALLALRQTDRGGQESAKAACAA